MQARDLKTKILAAAVCGILAGGAAMTSRVHAEEKDGDKKTEEKKEDKHDCAGKNDCKGKGGCAKGDNGCAGKNSCKGKGGCKSEHKKKDEKKEDGK